MSKQQKPLTKDQQTAIKPILVRTLAKVFGTNWHSEYHKDKRGFVASHLAHLLESLDTVSLKTARKEINRSIATDEQKKELLEALDKPQKMAA